jgi:hypothetical protein
MATLTWSTALAYAVSTVLIVQHTFHPRCVEVFLCCLISIRTSLMTVELVVVAVVFSGDFYSSSLMMRQVNL